MQFLEGIKIRTTQANIGFFVVFFVISHITLISISIFNTPSFDIFRVLYVSIFLNISVFPLFMMDKTKGRYALITIFLPIYFILFCIGDLFSILGIENKLIKENEHIQNEVDSIIIWGGIAYIVGYMATINFGKKQWEGWFTQEWDYKKIKIIGIGCWLLGTWAFITVFFFKETSSLPLSIVSNLKNFAQIGDIMLIYNYLSRRESSTLIILVILGLFDLCLGFAANTKEVSFITPLLYLILSFIAKGKIKKMFLFALIAVMIIYTTFFNVYRLFVIQVRHQTPLEAISNIARTMDLIIDNINTPHVDNKTKATTFLKERIETRKYIIILVSGIEKGVPTMDGYTLTLFFKSFIPRIFWPEKPEIAIGKLFNYEFRISASRLTYIPATHLGEFYWNFKMPGVIIGMTLIGFCMAFLSKMSDLSVRITLPRVLSLMMFIYIACVRFEADWAQQYSNVVRALFIIWFLDLFLRERKSLSPSFINKHITDIRMVKA